MTVLVGSTRIIYVGIDGPSQQSGKIWANTMSKRPILIITVHGTFGTGSRQGMLKWHEKGSNFTNALLAKIKGYSSVKIIPFNWSGSNFLSERIIASLELHKLILSHIKPRQKIYIICHSHGGTIALQAMDGIVKSQNNVKLIMISTPIFLAQKMNSKERNDTDFWSFFGGMYWIYWIMGYFPAYYISSQFSFGFGVFVRDLVLPGFVGLASVFGVIFIIQNVSKKSKLDELLGNQFISRKSNKIKMLTIGSDNDEVDTVIKISQISDFMLYIFAKYLKLAIIPLLCAHVLQFYAGALGGKHCYNGVNFFLPYVTKCTSFFEPVLLWTVFVIFFLSIVGNLCKSVIGWDVAFGGFSVALMPRRFDRIDDNVVSYKIDRFPSRRNLLIRHSLYKHESAVSVCAEFINRGGITSKTIEYI